MAAPSPDNTLAGQLYEKLIHSIDGILWEADAVSFRFSFVSEQAERLLGYRREQWYAPGFWVKHIHPDDRERALAYCLAQAQSGNDHAIEYRMRAANGTLVWMRAAATVERREGAALVLRGLMVPVAENRQTEDMTRLSATVFEHSSQGITITDAAMRILRVNRAFSVITGYAADEVVGHTHALLRSGRHSAEFYREMWDAIHQEGYWTGEVWNRRKNGEIYAEQLSITRVLDEQGKVVNYIGICTDISTAKAAQNEIARLSYFDALTGLPNRTLLLDRLQHILRKSDRYQRRFAVLAIDLDRLAHINEVLGHHIGDRLLVAAAGRLKSLVRGSDTVSRHLGDEFAIIFEDLEQVQAVEELAGRVVADLSRPFLLEGQEVNITACVGISIFPEDGGDAQMLLKHADVALHHAKDSGESSYQFFSAEMNQVSAERLQIGNGLRQALHRGELHLVYQPQVELASGRITGAEALLRWNHDQLGPISPTRFIPIAEETGQIIDIGLWVLREACRQTVQWHNLGYQDLQVAVNVSARQFRQDDFSWQVKRVLQETGLPPEALELELTESMIMERPERVVSTMAELRSLGVQFSIDDFGTGYSSLSQLKRFPIDKLKIDQSFIQDIGADAHASVIACAIIALGNSMRLNVVAEGVETVEQQRFLVENGCHSMQGYLFSKPVGPHGLATLLNLHGAVEHAERRQA